MSFEKIITPPDDGLPVTSRNAARRRGKPKSAIIKFNI